MLDKLLHLFQNYYNKINNKILYIKQILFKLNENKQTILFNRYDRLFDIAILNNQQINNINNIVFENIQYPSYIFAHTTIIINENNIKHTIIQYHTGENVENITNISNYLKKIINDTNNNYNLEYIETIKIYKKYVKQ